MGETADAVRCVVIIPAAPAHHHLKVIKTTPVPSKAGLKHTRIVVGGQREDENGKRSPVLKEIQLNRHILMSQNRWSAMSPACPASPGSAGHNDKAVCCLVSN